MKKIFAILSVVVMALTACTQQTHKVKVLAHRGHVSAGKEVVTDENSLDALRRAQELGVNGVEFDVHLTADNQLVVHHDNKIAEGLSCQGSTFDEIRAYRLPFGNQIPTPREWLEQAKQTPHIMQMIEIKAHKKEGSEAEIVRQTLAIIHELDMLDQICFVSFNSNTLDEVKRQEPNAKVVFNSSSLSKSWPPKKVHEHGYDAVSYNVSVILNRTEWIEEFRSYGIDTFLWMVNSDLLHDIASECRFDWITSDYCELFVK
ncbi:MAG: hypothetical protein IJ348_05195 [Alistipes sp.]|nr:hypothetical protein [Alistipes sp.]